MLKCSLVLPIILILLCSLNSLATEAWLEVKTKRFEVYGNVSVAEIVKTADSLEKLHQVVAQNFPKTQINVPFPTKIIVLKDSASINRFNLNLKRLDYFFVTADDANYGIIQLNNSDSTEQVYAGYAKFLIENNFGRNVIPAWMFEGLGEYFSNLKLLENNRFELFSKWNNAEILQSNKQIPIKVLLETDYFSLQRQESDRKNLFRVQSLALLQFLLKESDNKLQNIEKFIEVRQGEVEVKKALTDAFQISLAKLNEEFTNFTIENNKVFQKGEILQTGSFSSLQISEAKSMAVVADYFYYLGNLKDSESFAEKSVKLEPNQPLALTTLALVKAKRFYYDEAERLATKAVEVEPDNYLNHYRLAVCLSRRGMTEYGFVSGYDRILANRIRENVEIAIELNSEFAASYALFAFVNYVRNDDLDLSLEMIAKALQFAKGNHQYQLRLSELNLRKENFLSARKLAFGVLQNTPIEGVRLYAQNTIQRIDSTEFQLDRIKNNKAKYVNDDLVTDEPLSDEEIKKLREKAVSDQIKLSLRRPFQDEIRVFGSIKRIECAKNKVDFVINTATGQLKIQANSLDGISLLSLVEDMSDYRLNCGSLIRENYASIIYKKDSNKNGEIISIEFVPKWFKL